MPGRGAEVVESPRRPPTPPRPLRLRRVPVEEGLGVAEAVVEHGYGRLFDPVLILGPRDGKTWRGRRCVAEPFRAPERVGRMEA